MKSNKSFLIAFLLLALINVLDSKAQSNPGVLGKKNIVGLKFDWIIKPISPYKHLYYERMLGKRINIGASFHFGKSLHHISREDIPLSQYGKITTSLNETTRYVYDLAGDLEQKKSGFEIYLKCFRKINPARNYGLYWAYKYGQIRAVSSLKTGAELDLNDPSGGSGSKTYKTVNDSRTVAYKSYLGFEIGNAFPFIVDGLMLNISFSLNAILQAKENLPYETSIAKYIEVYSKNYINLSHPISLNIGLNYAL